MRDKLLGILCSIMAVYTALAFGLAVIVTLIVVGPLALAAEAIERLQGLRRAQGVR